MLGGGLPLGNTLTLLAPDPHTQWARLVARHVASAGLLDGQRVVVLAPRGREGQGGEFVGGMPWVEGDMKTNDKAGEGGKGEDGGSESEAERMEDDGRTKIAWRYDRMARFRTTVGESTSPSHSLLLLLFQTQFSLTPGSSRLAANTTLPTPLRAQLESSGTITYADPGESITTALEAVAAALTGTGEMVVRIVVPELGSADWPTYSSAEIVRFMLGLRALLRPIAAVGVISFPPRLSSSPPAASSSYSTYTYTSPSSSSDPSSPSTPTSSPWITILSHASDASITLQGFGTSPSHFRAFHPLHGLLTPHALPGAHHLLAPSLRHSTLLGVKDGGEQNLGFRLKRKKWVVESVHLGIEGGTSERKVGPEPGTGGPEKAAAAERVARARAEALSAAEAVEGVEGVDKVESRGGMKENEDIKSGMKAKEKKVRPRVRFGGDEVEVAVDTARPGKHDHDNNHDHAHAHGHDGQHKGRVEIRHDRPDLYEF